MEIDRREKKGDRWKDSGKNEWGQWIEKDEKEMEAGGGSTVQYPSPKKVTKLFRYTTLVETHTNLNPNLYT